MLKMNSSALELYADWSSETSNSFTHSQLFQSLIPLLSFLFLYVTYFNRAQSTPIVSLVLYPIIGAEKSSTRMLWFIGLVMLSCKILPLCKLLAYALPFYFFFFFKLISSRIKL